MACILPDECPGIRNCLVEEIVWPWFREQQARLRKIPLNSTGGMNN